MDQPAALKHQAGQHTLPSRGAQCLGRLAAAHTWAAWAAQPGLPGA